jgi:predicted secreted protein
MKEEYIFKTKIEHPVIISLPANQTTGFSWEIDFCDPMLECQQFPYRRYLGGLGAGGEQRFKVNPLQTGEFIIRFQLKRSWEAKAREIRTYRIVVKKNH